MWFRIRGAPAVGGALSGARAEAGLTQEALARELGVHRRTVIDMEAGRSPGAGRLIEAFSIMGYDLVAVPRAARVRVEEAD
jgi:transcriptional regulator with XRE-family HTH domain